MKSRIPCQEDRRTIDDPVKWFIISETSSRGERRKLLQAIYADIQLNPGKYPVEISKPDTVIDYLRTK
ncbi:hypothetical protein C6499_14215 [Candidatus Poribacteria bacterium]|nr:MAG: hypothetical protein C6499_14215 [Candidatus Poribacteria bacterium]